MKRLVGGLLMIACLCTLAQAQMLPEWSIWQNQRASLLIISKVDTGAGTFIGTFINNAAGYRCQGFAVPITGRISGSDVSFVANFAPCDNTITAWKGKVSGTTIPTDWVLWYVDKDANFHQIKDQDTFTKVN